MNALVKTETSSRDIHGTRGPGNQTEGAEGAAEEVISPRRICFELMSKHTPFFQLWIWMPPLTSKRIMCGAEYWVFEREPDRWLLSIWPIFLRIAFFFPSTLVHGFAVAF